MQHNVELSPVSDGFVASLRSAAASACTPGPQERIALKKSIVDIVDISNCNSELHFLHSSCTASFRDGLHKYSIFENTNMFGSAVRLIGPPLGH